MTEHWFNLWRQSGLDLDDALLAGATTSMAILGLVEEEQLFREMVHPGDGALAWTPNARLAFQRKADPDADFELVVRSLIDGIHARLTGTADEQWAVIARVGRRKPLAQQVVAQRQRGPSLMKIGSLSTEPTAIGFVPS